MRPYPFVNDQIPDGVEPLGRDSPRRLDVGDLLRSEKRPVRHSGSHTDGVSSFVNSADDDAAALPPLHAPYLVVPMHDALRSARTAMLRGPWTISLSLHDTRIRRTPRRARGWPSQPWNISSDSPPKTVTIVPRARLTVATTRDRLIPQKIVRDVRCTRRTEATMAKRKATRPKATRRTATKRELINTGTDKRLVRRGAKGSFKESDDVSRSLAKDRQQKAKGKVKSGQGDRGDR